MNFSVILVYALLAGLSALLGTAIVFGARSWTARNSFFLISFSAGVMLTIAFMNLIPEAAALQPSPWRWVFLGFLALYVLQHVVMFHPTHEESATAHLGLLSSIGLSLHSLLDGIIVSVGFEASMALGLLTTLAIVMHKIPDGIAITSILLHSKCSKARTLLTSVLVASLTPIGAVAGALFLRNIDHAALGALIAATSGSFIYLAASDLLPESHRVQRRGNSVFFFLGGLFVLLVEHFLH